MQRIAGSHFRRLRGDPRWLRPSAILPRPLLIRHLQHDFLIKHRAPGIVSLERDRALAQLSTGHPGIGSLPALRLGELHGGLAVDLEGDLLAFDEGHSDTGTSGAFR